MACVLLIPYALLFGVMRALVQYRPYAPLPKATTLNASNVMAGSALLNATVNPQGAATVCYFEYGVTTNYGLKSVTNALPAGTNTLPWPCPWLA